MSARNPAEERTIGSVEDSNSFKLSFLPEGKFKKLYLHDEQANIDVSINNRYNIVDEEGPGQVVGFECATNNSDLILECFVFGDNISVKRSINGFTMNELLRLGRGLTPGEVELNPDGRSKDPPGIKDDQYPWLSRWKIDTGEDATGSSKQYIVCRFTPTVYQPYRKLVVNLFNSSKTSIAHIHTLSITRFYFERIPTESDKPARRGSPETYQTEKNVTPDLEYADDQLNYQFNPPSNAAVGSEDVEQPQEQDSTFEEVDEF